MPISVRVNVEEVDKKRLYEGKKGTYLDLTLWENKKGSKAAQFGDFIVKQQGKKGEEMPILGNAKYFELDRKRRRDEEDEDYDQRRSDDREGPDDRRASEGRRKNFF